MGLGWSYSRKWPSPSLGHTLTSSLNFFQTAPSSGPQSALPLNVAEVTRIQRSLSPPQTPKGVSAALSASLSMARTPLCTSPEGQVWGESQKNLPKTPGH